MTCLPEVTPRWIGAVALAVSTVLPVAVAAPAHAAPSRSHVAKYERHLITAVNAERARRHLPNLRLASCPDRYAEHQAARLRASSSLVHQSMRTVLRGCSATRASENLARGDVVSKRIVSMWMHSSGHRANILDRLPDLRADLRRHPR